MHKKLLIWILVLTFVLALLMYQAVMLSLSKEDPGEITDMVVEENGIPWLILPISHKKINIDHSQHYLDKIDPAMLQTAEEKLLQQINDYTLEGDPCFYLGSHDGQIWLCMELIVYKNPPHCPTDPSYTRPTLPQEGCGIDHDHLTFSEVISKVVNY